MEMCSPTDVYGDTKAPWGHASISYNRTVTNKYMKIHSFIAGNVAASVDTAVRRGHHLSRLITGQLKTTNMIIIAISDNNNNNKIIIIISKTMFIVLSSWQSHCESSPGSFDECRTAPSGRRPKTKPDNLGCESACRLPESTPTIVIYYYCSARKLTHR